MGEELKKEVGGSGLRYSFDIEWARHKCRRANHDRWRQCRRGTEDRQGSDLALFPPGHLLG